MANPVYVESSRVEESMPSTTTPLMPTWAPEPFYEEGLQSTSYAESTVTPYPTSVPTASAVFWGVSPPEPLGWDSEPPVEDSCPLTSSDAYGPTWMGMHPPTAPSPLQSSCCPSFQDDDSWRSLSPSSQAVHEEFYTPPAEPYYGPDYFQSGDYSSQSSGGIALQDVQAWQDPSGEDQFHREQSPYPTINDPGEAYPTPPEVKVEPDAHSPLSITTACYSEECIELKKDPKDDRLSPSSACRGATSKVLARPMRASKIMKPRSKTRARPARAPKRMPRDGGAAGPGPRNTASTANGQCPHCTQILKNNTALQKHITVAHTRPFSCVFNLYGCSATFGSKNEWKRHVASQHLRLGIWRCDLEGCQPQRITSRGSDVEDLEEELIYNDFNRKDLFTQHLRRMHTPSELAGPMGDKAALSTWLSTTSQRCLMDQRRPPGRAVCGFCAQVFDGSQAWEQRMEHVGRHLESGLAEEQEWCEDIGLREWMAEKGLLDQDAKGHWVLNIGAPVTTTVITARKDTRGR